MSENIPAVISLLEQVIEDLRLLLPVPVSGAPVLNDIRNSMPYNPKPNDPWFIANKRTDWERKLKTGITIHHMGATVSALDVARYITNPQPNGKGLPRTQYHAVINAAGTIDWCLDWEYAPWHDQCGASANISVCLNGDLRGKVPPRAQMDSAVKLVRWLMQEFNIGIDKVDGHNEWAKRCTGRNFTACPGWELWKTDFLAQLAPEAGVSFSVRAVDLADVDSLTQ